MIEFHTESLGLIHHLSNRAFSGGPRPPVDDSATGRALARALDEWDRHERLLDAAIDAQLRALGGLLRTILAADTALARRLDALARGGAR